MTLNPNMTSEQEISQKPAIELLKSMGYKYISPEEAEGLREGRITNTLLKPILEKKLNEINGFDYKGENYKFSEKNIKQAMLDIDEPLIDGLIKTSEKIYDNLILGKSYEERLSDGAKKSFSLKYIDWETISNNEFHVTEEFTIEKTDNTKRRPDIVLFINGIPFAVIECKKAAISVKEGISQMIRNQGEKEIPNFFKFVQIVMSMNKNEAKYATVGTPEKFWAVWHEENIAIMKEDLEEYIKDRIITEQDKALYSLLSLDRVMNLLSGFIIYDKNVKKITRYQQYYSIMETIKRIKSFENEDNTGKRKGGLIWHTQGSGKSLTMVMLAKAIMKDKTILNPKVVVVTDRVNLDKQIKNTFMHTGMSPIRANTGLHLAKILRENKASIITTIINKFEAVLNLNEENSDNNIFVLVDESHRTQFGEMHNRMKKVFPEACYIGFTGTPIMKKDKNSMERFGGEIHRYTIDQAVRDGAVLPLLYEGKMVEQTVNKNAIDMRLEMITKGLEENQKEEVMKKWSQFEKIASSVQRLELIAFDINDHFIKTWKNTGFKAMLACNSKIEAVKYKKIFDEMGEIKTEVIISPPDAREGYDEVDKASKDIVKEFWDNIIDKYGTQEEYEESVKDEYENGDEVDIMIVVDKLLTGYDAPKAAVLYIDKPLKDHGLLQAIARVNRLYNGKDYGYIIDYRGLLGNLDKALEEYSEAGLNEFENSDIAGALHDISEILSELKSSYSSLKDIFRDIKNKNDIEEYEVLLEDDELRDEFYDILNSYSKYIGIVVSSEKIYSELGDQEIKKYKKELKFFQEIRKNVKLRYSDTIDHKEYEAKLQKLLDNYVNAEEIIRITNPVDIFDKEKFEEEISRVKGDRAKADTIRTRVSKKISEKYDENPSFYKKFSDRIEEVLNQYKEKRISEADYLNKMKDIMNELYKGDTASICPEIIKNNPNAKAIYGNIYDIILKRDSVEEEKVPYNGNFTRMENLIAELSSDIDEIIQNRIKTDWKENTEVHKKMEQDIDDLIFDFSKENNIEISFEQIDEIIDNIKTIALKRYKG